MSNASDTLFLTDKEISSALRGLAPGGKLNQCRGRNEQSPGTGSCPDSCMEEDRSLLKPQPGQSYCGHLAVTGKSFLSILRPVKKLHSDCLVEN